MLVMDTTSSLIRAQQLSDYAASGLWGRANGIVPLSVLYIMDYTETKVSVHQEL